MLTPEQQQEIITGAMEQIKEAIITDAISSVKYSASLSIAQETREIVAKFIAEEVAPELRQLLIDKKADIIKAALISADDLAAQIATAMAAKVSENMARNYKRDEIFKALFS